MAYELAPPLVDALVREAEAQFAALIEMTKQHSQDAKASTHSVRFAADVHLTLGILHSVAGDELAFEVELASREETLWCEVTMFVGQSTRVTIAMCSWASGAPTGTEISAAVRDAFSIILPRAELAFRALVLS